MIFDAVVGHDVIGDGLSNITAPMERITSKDFGKLAVTQAPYRQVTSSTIGDISTFSQGELDLLVTISSIITRQVYYFDKYDNNELKKLGIKDFTMIAGIVIIDEVDLHLHPRAQENYIKVLTETFPSIQFVITTHSPFVVRGLPQDSKVISLPSGEVFDNNFSAMDIDSITNLIFDHEGGVKRNSGEIIYI